MVVFPTRADIAISGLLVPPVNIVVQVAPSSVDRSMSTITVAPVGTVPTRRLHRSHVTLSGISFASIEVWVVSVPTKIHSSVTHLPCAERFVKFAFTFDDSIFVLGVKLLSAIECPFLYYTTIIMSVHLGYLLTE